MDFAALPPEVNSGRVYAGPGSSPMLAAAASWDNLAAELSLTAGNYGAIVANLTSGPWRGPASASMAAAALPYVSWMAQVAAQAEQTAGQAKAAAGAYETAFAMTVPPPVIATNRALLASLIATNFLGQNTPAIAATEAHYAEMWAQDAAAMYGYAGSSAAASALAPYTEPPATTTADAPVMQAAAVSQANAAATGAGTQQTLSQLTSAIPQTLQGLASPVASTASTAGTSATSGATNPLSGLFGDGGLFSSEGLGLNDNFWNTIFSSGFYMPGNFLGTMTDFAGMAGVGEAADAAGDAAAAGGAALGAGAAAADGLGGALAAPLGGLGGLGGVAAGMGQATSIGPLSVPPTWVAPAAMSPLASSPGNGLGALPAAGPGAAPSMLGGMPLAGPSLHGTLGDTPRYGFRPTVVAHPPAAG